MAENYTQFAVFVPLKTKAEVEWVEKTLSSPPKELMADWCDEEDAYLEFDWDLDKEGETAQGPGVYIYSYGEGNPNAVEAFFELFLREAPTQLVALEAEFSHSCSKPRVGEFGGSAVLVKKTGNSIRTKWSSTSSWLRKEKQRWL